MHEVSAVAARFCSTININELVTRRSTKQCQASMFLFNVNRDSVHVLVARCRERLIYLKKYRNKLTFIS